MYNSASIIDSPLMQSSGVEGAPLITAGQPHGSGTKCHQASVLKMMLINTAALRVAKHERVLSAPSRDRPVVRGLGRELQQSAVKIKVFHENQPECWLRVCSDFLDAGGLGARRAPSRPRCPAQSHLLLHTTCSRV